MKLEVLEFLKEKKGTPSEQYNKAMELYRKSEGHSVPSLNYYNRSGFSASNLESVCYDLKKIHNVSDLEIRAKNVKNIKVKAAVFVGTKEADTSDVNKELGSTGPENKENDTDVTKSDTDVQKNGTDAVKNGTLENNSKNTDPDILVVPVGDITTYNEIFRDAPVAAVGGLKIREEFPFLAEKECPDEFKILVADMFTAWGNFKDAHKELVADKTDAELFVLAKEAIENFQLNKEIWDELNYYKENKEVLGNHPIFKEKVLKAAVAKMTPVALMKRKTNLKSYVSKEKKKLIDNTDEASISKINKKIEDYNQELTIIENRLEPKE